MSAVETALIAVGLAALVWIGTLAARRAVEARADDIARIAQLEANGGKEGQEQVLEDRMTAQGRMAEQQRKDSSTSPRSEEAATK